MIRKNPSGDLPVVHESAFVDPTAILCGKVVVEANVFIGPYAVIRADEVDEQGGMEPILIGAGSNIQDGVVIHCKAGGGVTIGQSSSIAHRSIVHGPCKVGNNVFIGFNSVLFNCTVGDGSVVRHNSVVEGCHVPRASTSPRRPTSIRTRNWRISSPSLAMRRVFRKASPRRTGRWSRATTAFATSSEAWR